MFSIIRYTEKKLKFSLVFPKWWKTFCVVDHVNFYPEAKKAVNFKFKYKGKVYGNIFSIFVFKMTKREWVLIGYDGSPFRLIFCQKGRIYACLTPEELPEEFLNKNKSDYDYKKYGIPIQFLRRMVNQDVPQILKTFSPL